MVGVRIVGIGVALPGTESVPGRIVKNQELVGELVAYRDALVRERRLHPPDEWPALPGEKAAEHEARWKALTTDDAWIRKMTGIYERCVADDCVATSDLATVAARSALTVAGLPVTAITHLRVGTVLPDYVTTPPTSALVQHKLGMPVRNADGALRHLSGADITCACSTFLKALEDGYAAVASGLHTHSLVIGADVMSRTVSHRARDPYMILGDGGGALVLAAADDDAFLGARSFFAGLDGEHADLITVPMGGTAQPFGDTVRLNDPFSHPHKMHMEGHAVKRRFDRLIPEIIETAVQRAGLRLADVHFFALHQANARMLKPAVQKLRRKGFRGIAFSNIRRYGNTTSASVPLVLWEAWQRGGLKPGMLVLAAVFGGGLSWHTALFRWTLPNPART